MSLRRIQKELREAKNQPTPNVSIQQKYDDDYYHLQGLILGPVGFIFLFPLIQSLQSMYVGR